MVKFLQMRTFSDTFDTNSGTIQARKKKKKAWDSSRSSSKVYDQIWPKVKNIAYRGQQMKRNRVFSQICFVNNFVTNKDKHLFCHCRVSLFKRNRNMYLFPKSLEILQFWNLSFGQRQEHRDLNRSTQGLIQGTGSTYISNDVSLRDKRNDIS